MALLKVQNFINGEFVPAQSFLESFDPSTGEVWAHIPDSGEEEVNNAVRAAQQAFTRWSKTPVQERSKIMNKIADILESRLEEFAELESHDQGKPVWLAKVVDIPRAVHNFRFFASSILHELNRSTVIDTLNAVNYTIKQPLGVAGLISPWNLPLYLLTFKLAPAVITGNTVVAKPSEMTSVTAYKLCEIFNEAGLPAGVINMVFGLGPKAGQAIVSHPDVPIVSFTGGTATAEKLRMAAAPFAKKLSLEQWGLPDSRYFSETSLKQDESRPTDDTPALSLADGASLFVHEDEEDRLRKEEDLRMKKTASAGQLGGKNPAVIFSDADMEKCIPTTIRSSFMNQGEICLCTSRIYVQKDIYKEFVDKFVTEAKKLQVGDPKDEKTFTGALISKEHLAKVKGYVLLARQEGADVKCGEGVEDLDLPEKIKNGYFMRPTVITNVSDNSRLMKEEIFGPVTCIVPFETEEEVTKRANSVKYGLAATVWTQDVGKLHRVSQNLQAGTVWANCWLLRDLNMPFGGTKESGVGREGARDSVAFFTEEKTICVKI